MYCGYGALPIPGTSCHSIIYEGLVFTIDTDASQSGIGAVLSQVQNGTEKVIVYASRSLTKAERRYSVTCLEMLAVVNKCSCIISIIIC